MTGLCKKLIQIFERFPQRSVSIFMELPKIVQSNLKPQFGSKQSLTRECSPKGHILQGGICRNSETVDVEVNLVLRGVELLSEEERHQGRGALLLESSYKVGRLVTFLHTPGGLYQICLLHYDVVQEDDVLGDQSKYGDERN